MVQLLLGAAFLFSIAFFIIRKIIKLPSRYERKPQKLSPWSALDNGIDPSLPGEHDS